MSDQLNQLRIRTPEGVEFPLTLASPILRFIAWIIDAAVMVLGVLILVMATCLVGSLVSIVSPLSGDLDSAGAFAILLPFLLISLYGMVLEWFWGGQTVGKRALRLKVVDAQGLHLTFSQVAVRNLLRAIDFFPLLYFTGGVVAMLSARYQRLGDLAANTIVVRVPPPPVVNLEKLLGNKYNSLREHPHLCARLRQQTTPTAAQIALHALQRRDALEADSRIAVFRELADHFRAMARFPEDTVVGMSDERFVHNCVDVVFRTMTGESTLRGRALGEMRAEKPDTDAEAEVDEQADLEREIKAALGSGDHGSGN